MQQQINTPEWMSTYTRMLDQIAVIKGRPIFIPSPPPAIRYAYPATFKQSNHISWTRHILTDLSRNEAALINYHHLTDPSRNEAALINHLLITLAWHNVKYIFLDNPDYLAYIYAHDIKEDKALKEKYVLPVKVGMVIFGNYTCEMNFVCDKVSYYRVLENINDARLDNRI